MSEQKTPRLLTINDLMSIYGCRRTALSDMRQKPDFPEPVFLPGSKRSRWYPEQFEPKPKTTSP